MLVKEAEVNVTYDGIKIEYLEEKNVWRFELRGRERKVESLAKAKEAIDKPEPKEKKPFTRIKAYMTQSWGNDLFDTVEITSLAEDESYDKKPNYWVVKADKTREKAGYYKIFEICEHNDKAIAEMKRLDKETERIKKEREAIVKTLKNLNLEA